MISHKKRQRAAALRVILRELAKADPIGDRRRKNEVAARMMLVKQLCNEGWTTLDIGALMNINHSTVIYHRNKWRNIFLPGWDAEKELWDEFQEKINELDREQAGPAENQGQMV